MDIAPEFLMLQQIGMVVTDANGKKLDDSKLWDFNKDGSWTSCTQLSWVAATNSTLHQQVISKIAEGFDNFSRKYPKP